MLLLKQDRAPVDVVNIITDLGDDEPFYGIRCPQCTWRPMPSSRWCCLSDGGPEPPFNGCGTTWNTFDTGGRCPGCDHQWRWTSCLRCGEWSPHDDWYQSAEE